MRSRSLRGAAWVACLVVSTSLFGSAFAAGPTPPQETVPAPQHGAQAPQVPPLSLADLEQIALQRNPTLAQAAAQIDISRARALQAGLYLNPTVGYDAEQMGLRGRGAALGERQGAFLQQEIVTAGKLRLSRAKYQAEAEAAEWQATAQQLRVVNGLHVAFYEVLAAEQLIAQHRELVKNAEDAIKTTEELVNVGQANAPDLLQAEVEANRERVALVAAEKRFRRSWEHLVTLAGAPELPPTPLAGKLDPEEPPLNWESSLARLRQESPEIQFIGAEIKRDQISVRREQVEPIPNVMARVANGWNFENRSNTTDVSLSVRVPLWDRNQGTIRQAKADLARAQAELARVELVLRRRLADAFSRYETAWESVRDFRERSLPQSRRAFELFQDYFKKRRATWPQVLVAERTYFQLSDEYVNALLDLRRADVEIKGLLLVDGLNVPPGPTPQGHIESVPKPR